MTSSVSSRPTVVAASTKATLVKSPSSKSSKTSKKTKTAPAAAQVIVPSVLSLSASPVGTSFMDLGLDPGFLPNDEVHDEADFLQWMQLREMAEIQARARTMNRPEAHPDFDGVNCVEEDCGAPLPPERLKLNKIRCIDCQSLLEQRNRRR